MCGFSWALALEAAPRPSPPGPGWCDTGVTRGVPSDLCQRRECLGLGYATYSSDKPSPKAKLISPLNSKIKLQVFSRPLCILYSFKGKAADLSFGVNVGFEVSLSWSA